MFIAEACGRLGKSGLNLVAVLIGLGNVAQAEAKKTAARVNESNPRLKLAGGRFCFTYASDGS